MEELVSESGKFILDRVMSGAIDFVLNALNIKSHLTDLPKMMGSIELTLLDPDSMELNPAQIELLKQLRIAVENMVHFEDERETRSKRRKIMSTTTSNLTQKVFFYFHAFKDATRQVTSIWKDLGPLAGEKEEIQNLLRMLSAPQGLRNSDSLMETAPCIRDEEVIGRDGDRDKILSLLASTTDPFSVLAITGIGGIGKTTLAQYLYCNVKTNFEVLIWVCVGQNFHFKQVIRKMVEFAKNERNLADCEVAQLQKCFLPLISDKKCFIVIDNVWDHRGLSFNWQELRKTLGFVGAGSRCIVTTRSESVARTLSNVDPFRLGDLDAQDARVLFKKFGFRQQQLEPELEEIGWQIAELCGNVPLVLRVIGGLLREKPATVVEWSNFRDELARRRSCNDPESDVTQILKLSYDHLHPEGLKRCFLLFSLFDKDFEFRDGEMIYLWRALGFVETQGNQSEAITAQEYFTCLINRGLLSIEHGDVKMHDVIHDLVISLAKSNYKMVDSHEYEFSKETRHVSFNYGVLPKFSVEEFPCPSLFQIKDRLQTLIMPETPFNEQRSFNFNLNFERMSKFEHLRVFSLPFVGLKEVPSSIGKLIHLRYLDLSGNSFLELPNSITQLVNLLCLNLGYCEELYKLPTDLGKLVDLEVLLLTECRNLQELPMDITKLEKLRYLALEGCDNLKHMPLGLGKLTNLEMLSLFRVRGLGWNDDEDVGGLAELNPLNNLNGRLEIEVDGWWSSPWEAKGGNLQAKEKLEDVSISFKEGTNADSEVLEGLRPHFNLCEMFIRGYKGERPPSWIDDMGCFLNLKILEIDDWKGFSCLGSSVRFPCLTRLGITNCKNMEYIESSATDLSAPYSLFPSLDTLSIYDVPKLKGWRRCRSLLGTGGATTFPKLKYLTISKVGLEVVPEEFRGLPLLSCLEFRHCEQLREIPEWIDTFSSLEYLTIMNCHTLMSLPHQIANLTNLKRLIIYNCPSLEERCQRQTGEDWPLIQHIPNIELSR